MPNAQVLRSPRNVKVRPVTRRYSTPFAAYLAHEVIPQNPAGFTIDPRIRRFPTFAGDIYIVSLDGFERRFRHLPSDTEVFSWLVEAAHLLDREDIFVGGWANRENGLFYLDVSVPVRGRYTAERIGHLYGQSSIYHPTTNAVIRLRKTKAA